MLEKGVIVYGKSGWDIARGKIHGSLDTGLSVSLMILIAPIEYRSKTGIIE